MKILLIGGTGNISQACGELLVQRGHQVTILNRGKSKAAFPCEVLQADRNAPGALKQALAGRFFDVIADFICFDEKDAAIAFDACNGRCGQYILISTTVVYEKPPKILPITETAPIGNRFFSIWSKRSPPSDFTGQLLERNFRLPSFVIAYPILSVGFPIR